MPKRDFGRGIEVLVVGNREAVGLILPLLYRGVSIMFQRRGPPPHSWIHRLDFGGDPGAGFVTSLPCALCHKVVSSH